MLHVKRVLTRFALTLPRHLAVTMMAALRSAQLDFGLTAGWAGSTESKSKQELKLPMGLFPGSLYVSPATVHQWKWLESAPAARDSLGLINWPNPIGVDAEADAGSFLRLDSLAASKFELPDRRPEHSRVAVNFYFSDDELLQLDYKNHESEVSIQRLLQDIDCMAGYVCRKHCLDESVSRPLVFYTALLDRLVVHKPLRCDTDMKLVGEVVRAGRSSLTIQVQALQQLKNEEEEVALDGRVSFIARDRITGGQARVNRLVVSDVNNKSLLSGVGAAPPPGYHTELVASLLRQGEMLNSSSSSSKLEDSVLAEETSLESAFLAGPEHLNSRGIVFGGLLMTRACDLALCCAYSFAGSGAKLREIYRVKFLEPLKAGSVVRLKAKVMYTDVERGLIHVEVRVGDGAKVALLFTAAFSVSSDSCVRVLPSTDEEARHLLDMLAALHM